MSEPYHRKRTFYQSINAAFNILAATDDTTLVTVRNANHTLFLQKLHVEITASSAGKTWTFKDSAGTPILLVPSIDAGAIAHFDFDFGPDGIPLTQGKNFLLDVSAAGAGGWITWEGYQKLTATNVDAASA